MNGNDITTTGLFNPNLRMSSVEIASLMDKNHFHVVRDIKELIDQGAIDTSSFGLISYLDTMNREQPMYELDFESSMVLVTGYDPKRRALVIKRWMLLERGEALPAVQQRQMVVVDIQEHIALLKEHTDLLKQAMASLKKEANNRKNFTADDDAKVLHMHGLGYTPAQIGDAIGRKKGSVRSCLRRLHKKGLLADAKDVGQMELFPAGVLDGREA